MSDGLTPDEVQMLTERADALLDGAIERAVESSLKLLKENGLHRVRTVEAQMLKTGVVAGATELLRTMRSLGLIDGDALVDALAADIVAKRQGEAD